MKVTPKSIQSSVKKKKKGEEEKEEDEKNKNDENIKEMTVDDIIEYLRKVCCQALVYTPKNTFSINLPKVLNRPEEDENLDKRNKNKKNKEKKRNENAILPSNVFIGILVGLMLKILFFMKLHYIMILIKYLIEFYTLNHLLNFYKYLLIKKFMILYLNNLDLMKVF